MSKEPSFWCSLFHSRVLVVQYATSTADGGTSMSTVYVCPKCEPERMKSTGQIDHDVLAAHAMWNKKLDKMKP